MILFQGFTRKTSGQAAVIFALAIIPLVVGTGMAVDFSRGNAQRAELQSALDASVLAAVSVSAREKKLGTDPLKIARKTFDSTFNGRVSSISFAHDNGIVRGSATMSIESSFGGIVGVNLINVAAQSAATANPQRHPVCFMAMHPSRKHTLELKESVSVFAPDCNIYGNSDHIDDVVDPHTPENFLTGKTVQAVGYGHHYLQNVKPPLEHAPEILADPLASLRYPTPETCSHTGKVVTGNNQKLTPGTYCNGLSFLNAKHAVLEPGTYIIKGNTLSIVNSSIEGKGVTLVLTGSTAPVNWNNSKIELTAPRSGSLAGLAILADRVPSLGLITNTEIDVYGTIYMPNTEFEWINAGKFKPKSKWTVWIVDGVSWRGSGVININFSITNAEIPYPSQLMNVIPTVGNGRVRLVR